MAVNDLTLEDQKRLQEIREDRTKIMGMIGELKAELKDITNKIETEYIPLDGEDPYLFRKRVGIQKFHQNAKLGVEFLVESNIVLPAAESIAKFFLRENDQICKVSLGNYIGEISKPFNLEVLNCFVSLQNFAEMEYIDALRRFLATFNLPGEGQKIDKILECFATAYQAQNPGIFPTAEAVHILAYATILLNTVLHNDNIKSPAVYTNEDSFVKMMRKDDPSRYSEYLLRRLFNDIRMKPIRSNNAIASTQYGPVIMKGWLFKWAGRVKAWKKRYFVLTDNYLLYYLTPEKPQPKGEIPLNSLQILPVPDPNRKFTFSVFPASPPSPSSPPTGNEQPHSLDVNRGLHSCQTSPGRLNHQTVVNSGGNSWFNHNNNNNNNGSTNGTPHHWESTTSLAATSAGSSSMLSPSMKQASGSLQALYAWASIPSSGQAICRMAAMTEDERDTWIKEVRTAIQRVSAIAESNGSTSSPTKNSNGTTVGAVASTSTAESAPQEVKIRF